MSECREAAGRQQQVSVAGGMAVVGAGRRQVQ